MSSEDFKSLIVTDPDLIDEGIDVSDLRTQTDTNPRLLGAIEGYPGISYDPTSYSYLSDLNRLFASGLPTIDTSQPTTPPPDTGGGGGGGTSPGTGGTTPTQPDSIGGFDPGVTPGPSGFIGLDPEYDLDPKDYVDDYTYSPFTTNNTIQMENIGSPGIEDIMPGEFAEFGPVTIKETPTIGDYDDVTTVEGPLSKVRPPGFPQDYSVTGALGVDPLEKNDVLSGAVTQEDVDNPEGLLSKLGLKGFDPAEALVKTAVNAAFGKPVTLFIDLLTDLMPPIDPRQKALNEMYDVKDGTIQSGLMKGYNPVSGGGLYTLSGGQYGNEPTYGLQEAYQDRIDTIEKTLARKYPDGDYSDTQLDERLAELKEAKEKEKDRLDLFSGDIDERDQMLEDISLQNKIDAGIQAADDDKGDDMLDIFDTTPADTTNIVDEVALTGGKDKDDKPAPPAPPSPPQDTGGPPSVMNPPKSDPKPTQDFYQDPITTGGGGNQGNPGGSTGGCCFIMLESRYGDGTMDKVVRRYRDEKMTPRNRRGYYKVARVLVPLMRKSKVFKWIVAKTFADPLVSYGKWYYGENKHGWIFAPIKTAWLKIFDVVGTDTVFIRENGEEV